MRRINVAEFVGEIDVDGPARRALEDAAGAERDGFDLAGAGQGGEDDLARLRDGLGRVGPFGSQVDVRLGQLVPEIRYDHRVAGLENVECHRPAHVAQPDEADTHTCLLRPYSPRATE